LHENLNKQIQIEEPGINISYKMSREDRKVRKNGRKDKSIPKELTEDYGASLWSYPGICRKINVKYKQL